MIVARLLSSSYSFRSQIAALLCTRSYHPNVVQHYENPQNVGSFDTHMQNDEKVEVIGTGLVGAPACGDVMKLQVKVSPQAERITDARFKTFGCGSAIASSSVSTEWLKGMSLAEATHIRNSAIAKHLQLPPVKLHCSMLAEDAVRSAVADAKRKLK